MPSTRDIREFANSLREGFRADNPQSALRMAVEEVFSDIEVQEQILELNRSQMYDMNIWASGVSMPEYAPSTKRHKKAHGLPYDRYTLYETGKFYGSLEVYVYENGFTIVNGVDAPPYAGEYADALGLTPENKQEIANLVTPLIKRRALELL